MLKQAVHSNIVGTDKTTERMKDFTHFPHDSASDQITLNYAPINVNPEGGECGQGVGIWQILKFFNQIPQGGKLKVNQKCQKSPHPRGKNLNKQCYNTI